MPHPKSTRNPFNMELDDDMLGLTSHQERGLISENINTSSSRYPQPRSNPSYDYSSFQPEMINLQPKTSYGMDEDDDPPLLQDLGVDIEEIKARVIAVSTMKQIDERYLQEFDLAGPMAIALCLACLQLLSGEIRFGDIYGLGLSGTLFLWMVLNMISEDRLISVYNIMSVLGYCLIPFLVLALLGVMRLSGGMIGHVGACGAAVWATISASGLVQQYLKLEQKRWLVRYPIMVFYLIFVLIVVY